ncbi:uncharacterized protein [Gossypium hirsutum]|uniref:Uncharacterized protein isoform X2 n=1 Tax=Gossypium hirsutum TaxID=3635 RepID=A0ABM2Z6I3_GOSHI|nr:uncharacterized protein LOC107930207 isoform X2 [Gossypium hirsutum]XP_040938327.1 uncharacterized protein LOC107930207 isoform X2 [Gossypium hirsutum]
MSLLYLRLARWGIKSHEILQIMIVIFAVYRHYVLSIRPIVLLSTPENPHVLSLQAESVGFFEQHLLERFRNSCDSTVIPNRNLIPSTHSPTKSILKKTLSCPYASPDLRDWWQQNGR